MRNVRGFFQNFFTCSSGRTRFSKASYTPGYRKKLVSCVSNRSSSASYSRLDLRITRSRSVPCSIPFARRCSRAIRRSKFPSALRLACGSRSTRVRSARALIPGVRSSFSHFWGLPLLSAGGEEETLCLTKSACRDGPLGIFTRMDPLRGRAELRQRFVQLIREFDQLAHRRHRSARSLRRLPCNVGNNLHRVRHAFRSAHLLLRCQGDFLNEFC